MRTTEPKRRADAGGGVTTSAATRVLGITAAAGAVVWVLLALVLTEPDVVQGDAVRMFYIHVPAIYVAYGCFTLTWATSAIVLWRNRQLSAAIAGRDPEAAARAEVRARRNDRLAGAAAELGVLFTALTLVSGSLWGRVTWGTYWEWDARLTATVMMFVTYLGYLALRRLPGPTDASMRRNAIMALVSFLTVPLVHYSVNWWRTLHQEASRSGLGAGEYTTEMYITLLYSLAVTTLVAAWLITHRYRLARLEEMDEEQTLALAIEARRADTGALAAPDADALAAPDAVVAHSASSSESDRS